MLGLILPVLLCATLPALMLSNCGVEAPNSEGAYTPIGEQKPVTGPLDPSEETSDPLVTETPADTGLPDTKTTRTDYNSKSTKRSIEIKTEQTSSSSTSQTTETGTGTQGYWAYYGADWGAAGLSGVDVTMLRLESAPNLISIGLYEYEEGDAYYDYHYLQAELGGVLTWEWAPLWDFFCTHKYQLDIPDIAWSLDPLGSMVVTGSYIRDCGMFDSGNSQEMLTYTLSPVEVDNVH